MLAPENGTVEVTMQPSGRGFPTSSADHSIGVVAPRENLSAPSPARFGDAAESGFTLVEVAIVLVVVGLVISGVLKGQEMITNSKLKRIESDNVGIAAAMLTYQDRYRRIPGDDDRANIRFGLYTDGINDPAPNDINGNGDGIIDGNWMAAANTETANFWKHLRAAGLIDGGGDDDTQPTNAYGGAVGIRDGSLLLSGHAIIFGSIEGQIAGIIEGRLDDSSPQSGRIQSDLAAGLMNGGVISSAGASYNSAQRYFMAFRI